VNDVRMSFLAPALFEDLNFKQPRHVFAISRRITPELMSESCPSRMKRAQGRPGARPHPWPACNKKARGRTTGTAGSSGLPCAMVYRLIRALPGDHAWLPPSVVGLIETSDFDACIGASGPHDFAVRMSSARLASLARPPHPAPRFVTIGRNAPLHRGGMDKTMLLICPTEQARRTAAHWHDGHFAHDTHVSIARRPPPRTR
jgi:hypothetical protein